MAGDVATAAAISVIPPDVWAQLSLAWLLARKPFIVPIPGTGKLQHLLENIGASSILLTAEDLKGIEIALADLAVHGGRMNADQMKVVEAA